jgi:hypothetical protein
VTAEPVPAKPVPSEDLLVARIERRAQILALVMTAAAAAYALYAGGDAWRFSAGVFGGALLPVVSLRGLRYSLSRSSRLTMLVGRYALLALIAYVMIARLRLSPMGLLLGASVFPAAAAMEVVTTFAKHGKS